MIGRPLKILSIDDDYGCRTATVKYLALVGGYNVEAAENGVEGIRKASLFCPDLILLDMMMPDMNGFQVMDALQVSPGLSRIPVIMMTGSILNDDEMEKLRQKDNFLMLEHKPADFKGLVAKINVIFRQAAAGPAPGFQGAGGTAAPDRRDQI